MSDTLTNKPDHASGQSAPPIDLYREVHKGLRRALGELVATAGSLDIDDDEAVTAIGSLFTDIDMMLTTHHAHEEIGRLGELISEHVDAKTQRSIQDAHDWSDAALIDLRSRVAGLPSDRDAAGLYDAVVEFTAGYLAHMNDEEQVVMPALNSGTGSEELEPIIMQIRTSVPPPDMCVFLRYMLPAMNPVERANMLGGMKLGAPPEIFQMFWAAAEQELDEHDLAAVAARIG